MELRKLNTKDNIASQKVMINNGAYRAGEDEDHYFMRIAKEPAGQLLLINDDAFREYKEKI